ncbi:MAG: alkaline phosphatase [Desulfovibrio sp.]
MKRVTFFISSTLCLILMLAMCGPAAAKTALYSGNPVKYVFLFIGDGMAMPQRAAVEAFSGERLVIDTLPVQGMSTTTAADQYITDSAAAGTAIACATKTGVGVVGLDSNMHPVQTIAELAKKQGRKVGMVSSVSIDHATPASFYAHVPKRGQYYDIAMDLAASDFDFFGGGGLKDTTNKKSNTNNFRGDAIKAIKEAGYKIVTGKNNFEKISAKDGKVLVYNEWLQDSKSLPYAMDMTKKDITLPEFTEKAIEVLNNDEGFFLMVEGGKIDWACHANDAVASITNTAAFDQSVSKALEFAAKHPKETIIVVTGDHETGGLALGFAGTKYTSNFDLLKSQKASYVKFEDDILAQFKKDHPKASFNQVKPLITEYFGLKFSGDVEKDRLVLSAMEIEALKNAFNRTMQDKKDRKLGADQYLLYGGYDPLTVTLTHTLNNKAGLGWTSYKHTAVPVPVSAMGTGSEIFNGLYDNTDIAKKMMSIMGMQVKVYTRNTDQTLAMN